MKKLLLTATALCLLSVGAEAQYYGNSYGQPRYNQYGGGYSRQQGQSYQRQGQNYQRSSQQREYRSGTNQRTQQRKKKSFYVTPRLGYGGTFGWDDSDIDTPWSPILGVAVGAYFNKFRVEGEIDYHMKKEIYSVSYPWGSSKAEYSQLDFGVNGYYDFGKGSIRPFVGAGAGLSRLKVEATATGWGYKANASWTKTPFTLSAMAGCTFDITDMMAFEIMGRGRYIFVKEAGYNLEGIAGLRFSF